MVAFCTGIVRQVLVGLFTETSVSCWVQVMDALAMKFPDNSFDLVWACESGEHMPDKKKYVEEMVRVLKPGGVVAARGHMRGPGGVQATGWYTGHLFGKWTRLSHFLAPCAAAPLCTQRYISQLADACAC
jgi:SAM-dependent methyltransferase